MPCPYLDGHIERRVVAELTDSLVETGLFDELTIAGFRRSHNLVYRPACPGCDACVPVRIPVAEFAPNRSQRRARAANLDLRMQVRPAVATIEQYALFQRYQQYRHHDSDMAQMDPEDYRAMVEDGADCTHILELREPQGTLLACCLFDRLSCGLSAVYSFFDPHQPGRSFGSELIMRLIDMAGADGLPHVYLGYWIGKSQKMAYKTRFRPVEILGPVGWERAPETMIRPD